MDGQPKAADRRPPNSVSNDSNKPLVASNPMKQAGKCIQARIGEQVAETVLF